jgi:transketolase
MALKNAHTPTALILSRQNMKEVDLQSDSSYYTRAKKAEKGAYIVWESNPGQNPDVVLVANGSEVDTLAQAAKLLLAKKPLKISIVSAISAGLFFQQSEEYQAKVIPANTIKIGMTAGLPVSLRPLVGDKGYIFGVDHFGHSAPAGVLDQKLGFTPDQACSFIESCLK